MRTTGEHAFSMFTYQVRSVRVNEGYVALQLYAEVKSTPASWPWGWRGEEGAKPFFLRFFRYPSLKAPKA